MCLVQLGKYDCGLANPAEVLAQRSCEVCEQLKQEKEEVRQQLRKRNQDIEQDPQMAQPVVGQKPLSMLEKVVSENVIDLISLQENFILQQNNNINNILSAKKNSSQEAGQGLVYYAPRKVKLFLLMLIMKTIMKIQVALFMLMKLVAKALANDNYTKIQQPPSGNNLDYSLSPKQLDDDVDQVHFDYLVSKLQQKEDIDSLENDYQLLRLRSKLRSINARIRDHDKEIHSNNDEIYFDTIKRIVEEIRQENASNISNNESSLFELGDPCIFVNSTHKKLASEEYWKQQGPQYQYLSPVSPNAPIKQWQQKTKAKVARIVIKSQKIYNKSISRPNIFT
eukprot:TRINITY_DN20078_c0_g1_i3.p1 TRINITY_DN20078_c0_g1~~TRINITY_DN20078_c0_g1_i3.p1  ORF type:complete len:338 (-),score=22.95 TRINITY_DN20078_c0_g1_i3:245-1258(-)